MSEALRKTAKEILASGEAAVVVGYGKGRRAGLAVPIFARSPGDADGLIMDSSCKGGLAVFARREAASKVAAFVATREDARALKVLVQEKQIPAANVRIILCDAACSGGSIKAARLEDVAEAEPAQDAAVEAEVARLEALPPGERREYWKRQFERCVRCYACRAACPMCYCEECIAEKNLPQWIEVSARTRGNFAWNVIRAWHLAGRCVLCGACERACPEGIRLMVLNRMLADEVKEAFGYVAGAGGAEEAAVFASWKEQDKDDFIIAD